MHVIKIHVQMIKRLGQRLHHQSFFLSVDETQVALVAAILAAPPVHEVEEAQSHKDAEDDTKGCKPNRVLGETRTQSKKKKRQTKKGNGNINDWKKSPNPRGLAQPLCKAHGNPPHDYSVNKELALDFEEKNIRSSRT
jgi:hypothetical protein